MQQIDKIQFCIFTYFIDLVYHPIWATLDFEFRGKPINYSENIENSNILREIVIVSFKKIVLAPMFAASVDDSCLAERRYVVLSR